MDVHLRELRYFVAVAEELHFTRAAERLFVSQPALSKQIRALERQLGFSLLQRTPRGVTLTSEGAALLPTAQKLLSLWGEGLEAARYATSAMLVIGLQTAVGRNLQQNALQLFKSRMPYCDVLMRLIGWDDPSAGLTNGSSDVAFIWMPAPDGLATRVLYREPRYVALPVTHPLAERTEISLAELADEAFIALPAAAGALRDFWLGLDVRREVRIAGEATSAEETFEMIASGLGVVLLAEGNAALYERPDVAFRPVSDIPFAELAVAWSPSDRRPVVKAFLECLQPAARREGEQD